MSDILPHPTCDDRDLWQSYWYALGQRWRTEPEISIERQKYLASLRDTKTNGEQCIYPFQNVELSRDDIEWLLIDYSDDPFLPNWNDFIADEDNFISSGRSNEYQYVCRRLDLQG